MKKVISIVFILFSCFSSLQAEEWTSQSKVLYLLTCTSIIGDVYSTHLVLKEGGYEQNRLLGKHPSDTKLILAGVAGCATTFVIAELVGSEWRDPFLFSVFMIELGCVGINVFNYKY